MSLQLPRWPTLLLLAAVACGQPPDEGDGGREVAGVQAATVPVAGTVIQDFTTGTYALAEYVNSPTAAVTHDARGATKISYASAGPDQFSALQVQGLWDLSTSDLLALDVGFDTASTDTRLVVVLCSDPTGYDRCASAGNLVNGVRKPNRIAIPIPRSAFSADGAFDPAAVRRIEIRLVTTAAEGTSRPDAVYLYKLLGRVSSKARVVLSFDDGHASVYSAAYPIAKAAGMRGTLYLNGTFIGAPDNLTLAQVKELYAAGWDVGNHTFDHTALVQGGTVARAGGVATFTTSSSGDTHGLRVGDQVVLSGADQPEYVGTKVVTAVPSATAFSFAVSGAPASPATGWISFQKSPAWLTRARVQEQIDWATGNGLLRGREHFAYPQGYFDDAWIATLKSIGFLTGRTVNDDPFPTYIWPTYTGLNDAFHLPAYTLNSLTTADEALAYVDDAILKGASIHLYGHAVTNPPAPADVATPVFQAIVDGLRARRDAGLLDVQTISQWYTAVTVGAPVGAAPAVTGLSATSGAQAGGLAMNVTGTGFAAGAKVTFGGVAATVRSLTGTTIAVTTPAHAGGAVFVTVTNPDGRVATAPALFTYAPSAGTGAGLLGLYYATSNLGGAVVLQRTEAVNFNWGLLSPAAAVPADNFSARWTGTVEAPVAGTYQLQTNSDDGVRVWLNGQLVIDNWTAHSATLNTSAAVTMAAGQRAAIAVEYQELTGSAVMQLRWKSPTDAAFVAVPASRLYAPARGTGAGLLGRYYATSNFGGAVVLQRTEAVSFNWDLGSPAAAVPADNFSVRWTGTVEAPVAGSYQLQTSSDDGVRVWLNGKLVIDNWTAHSATLNTSAAVTMASGQRAAIVVEYQEFTGYAVMQLGWKSPTDTAFVPVPASRLYTP